MARGRKPKPVELQKALGNPGKRALPEPVLLAGRTTELLAPLRLPEEAQDVWNELVPVLASVGMLDGVDAVALEGLCVLVARARQAQEHVDHHGLLLISDKGKLSPNPMVKVERDS